MVDDLVKEQVVFVWGAIVGMVTVVEVIGIVTPNTPVGILGTLVTQHCFWMKETQWFLNVKVSLDLG